MDAQLFITLQRIGCFASLVSPLKKQTSTWNIAFRTVFLSIDLTEDTAKIRRVVNDFTIAYELYGGRTRRGRSDFRQCHLLNGSAAECGGPEESLFVRTIGNAIHPAPGLPGRVGDTLQGQASTVGAWRGSLSKRDLHFFKELFALRLRKTNDQPNETRQ